MNNVAITVICPVYKAEHYLHRCVDSILAQTFSDFELLLIDDGSPDRSGEICDEYARKDSRVRVFHKENGGVASARQKGMDNAQGEYTIHADPDDWVEPDMLEELYKKAKEEDADMVICDFYYETCNTDRHSCIQRPLSLECEELINQLLFQQLHGSCCNKLLKKACYSKPKIQFEQDLTYSEDVFFNICVIKQGIKVVYLSKAFYHYDITINIHSIMRNKNNRKKFEQVLLFLEKLKSAFSVYQYAKGYSKQYADLAIRAFCCHYYPYDEYKANIAHWQRQYKFMDCLSRKWKVLILLSTKCYLYNIFNLIIHVRRQLKRL